MPSLQTARRVANAKNNGAKTIGQIYKEQSDELMEWTWDNDIQSKVCYIYDYFHDDQPELKDHMTYDNTTKTRIDAKFIIKTYQSMDKDQVEYYLQFKPSQKTEFSEGDELYYFEADYRKKYHNDDFIGMFIDIPDDKGIYRKWIICKKEIANQFVKFLILPVNYQLMWIETKGQEKIKRKMWCVLRNQNSYNSGIWRDYIFTSQENQNKLILPLNTITEKIWYTNENSKNMRVLVSAFTENPVAWIISKVETANNLGLQMLTLYQDLFDQNKDYIEKDSDGNIIGLWADYYDSNIEPTDPDTPSPTPSNTYGKITASTSTIKVGGSYKTLTLKLYDADNNEVTDNYSSATFDWTCYIKGNETDDLSEAGVATLIVGSSVFNQAKIKFADDRSYLGKILVVHCCIFDEHEGYINVLSEFELVV